MYRFRRNVTVIAIETQNVRDKIDGPTRRWTHIQRYSLDMAVNPYRFPGIGLVAHRMGVGRVTVRHVQHASA